MATVNFKRFWPRLTKCGHIHQLHKTFIEMTPAGKAPLQGLIYYPAFGLCRSTLKNCHEHSRGNCARPQSSSDMINRASNPGFSVVRSARYR